MVTKDHIAMFTIYVIVKLKMALFFGNLVVQMF